MGEGRREEGETNSSVSALAANFTSSTVKRGGEDEGCG